MDELLVETSETGDIPILLNCDYADRNRVKELGAKWHQGWGMWYVNRSMDKAPFKKWSFTEDK